MDKKDRNSLLMAAGGAAIAGASMLVGQSLAGVEVTNDILEAAKIILGFIPGASAVVSAIGFVQLAVKYGGKAYQLLKQKFQEKYHISEKEADKMLKSLSNDTNSASKTTTKERGMTDVMKKAYNRGAPINNQSRRSARNPSLPHQLNGKLFSSEKQSIR